ncbi:hypothetical protein ACHWQZ_G009235 [Mnemiopsis leidyi]
MLVAPQIKGIDKSSVHNICSGQVIVTLATAVKELVENSIDAGAKAIHVTFREHGAKAIEVSDDGKGISEADFCGLTLKHHTSKINKFEDISDVSTFGFRGEALSSLCALGHLSVLTSTGGLGTNLCYEKDGSIAKSTPHARPKGTTVVIENLFQSLPVRHREFLKNLKKEFHKAIDALQAYAMVSVNIRIHCINIVNKRKQVIFSTQGKSTLKDNIIDVLGCPLFKNLTFVDYTDSIFHVYGYISKPLPKHGRGSADKQYFYINGRPCDHEKLSKTVNSIFRQHEKFQYPVCVLVIDIAKNNIDVNVTPDKRKLFIDNENKLIEGLTKYLEEVFQKFAGVFVEQSSAVQLTLFVSEAGLNRIKMPNLLHYKKIQESPKSNCMSNVTEDVLSCEAQSHVQTVSIAENDALEDSHHKKIDLSASECVDEYRMEIFEAAKPETTNSDKLNSGMIMSSNSTNSVEGFVIDILEPVPTKNEDVKANNHMTKAKSASSSHEQSVVNRYDIPDNHRKRRKISLKCSSSLVKKQSIIYQNINQTFHGNLIHFNHQIVSSDDAEKELNQQITKQMFREMEVLGQFNLGFILVKLKGNLFIIDQHATDEKFRYEKLRRETQIENQKLICPKSMALNGAQEDLLLAYKHIFDKNGFSFSFDDSKEPGKRISLTGVPRSKSLLFDESDVQELLWLLSEESTFNIENLRPSKVHRMFASRACRSAVMIGTALDFAEMRKIVDHMADMEHPWNCPHGRPTMRHVVDLSRIS